MICILECERQNGQETYMVRPQDMFCWGRNFIHHRLEKGIFSGCANFSPSLHHKICLSRASVRLRLAEKYASNASRSEHVSHSEQAPSKRHKAGLGKKPVVLKNRNGRKEKASERKYITVPIVEASNEEEEITMSDQDVDILQNASFLRNLDEKGIAKCVRL